MTTLGDVWAITAAIVGVAACAWALLLCLELIFPDRARVASEQIRSAPIKMILLGLAIAVVVGGVSIAMLSSPLAVIKVVGWIGLLWVLAMSFSGTSGLALIAGERVNALDPNLSAYGARSRGAMFIVLPSILPILGWFLFAPLIFCLGLGTGVRMLRRPSRTTVPA